MNVSDERTRSLWMDVTVAPSRRLDGDRECDAVIVGSGIAGLSTAFELACAGLRVIVLDRGQIGYGMTARTTGHLASALDDYYSEFFRVRSEEMARVLYRSVATAIDHAEWIATTEQIDCDFKRLDGYLFLAPGTDPRELDDELAACRKLEIPVEDIREPLKLQSDGASRSIRFPKQARFHALKYLAGLAHGIAARGGLLFSDTTVESVDENETGVVVKTTDGHCVRGLHAVMATNAPINDRVAVHSKEAPYRTYVIAAELPKGALDDALYWDTLDPYHYVHLAPLSDDRDFVIVGGEDHKTGQADDGDERFAKLESWARHRLPEMGPVTHRWSGQVLEPFDFAGFIGRNPGNRRIYMASGDSGQGITGGIVASLLICGLIVKDESTWRELYEPSRKPIKSLGEYVSENATAIKSFAEYLTAGDIDSAQQLAPGEGAILRRGMAKIAAARDRNGALHLRSASCTHLGCIVHWNSLEQCWDCPCHGSQFAPDGTALNGPAVSALADETETMADAAE